MIELTICKTTGCENIGWFFNQGEIDTYCDDHRDKDMTQIGITNGYFCMSIGCNKGASFSLPGETPKYCKTHKTDDMGYTGNNKCIEKDCYKQGCWNLPGLMGRYCINHKTNDMIQRNRPQCCEEGCDITPSWGFPGKTSRHCKTHALAGMERTTKDKKRECMFHGCKICPSYNWPGKKTKVYCTSHKETGMIIIGDNKCKTPLCGITRNPRYKGYCVRCFVHMFPDERNARNYKSKEKHIADHIKETLPQYDWRCDQVVADGCSKRRPDILLHMGTHAIIVEVDENQHENYDITCENKRSMEIYTDLNYIPIVFIRFNPDGYDNIKTPWITDKKGIQVIRDISKKEWNDRLLSLCDMLKFHINNPSDRAIQIEHMYFDTIQTKKDNSRVGIRRPKNWRDPKKGLYINI
jgi:hypothetical protein